MSHISSGAATMQESIDRRVAEAMDWYVGTTTNLTAFIKRMETNGLRIVSEESLFVALHEHDTDGTHCGSDCSLEVFRLLGEVEPSRADTPEAIVKMMDRLGLIDDPNP